MSKFFGAPAARSFLRLKKVKNFRAPAARSFLRSKKSAAPAARDFFRGARSALAHGLDIYLAHATRSGLPCKTLPSNG